MSKRTIRWAAGAALAFIAATGIGGWESERWESFKKRAVAEMSPANAARLEMVSRADELSRRGAGAPSRVKAAVDLVEKAYDDPLAYLVFERFAKRPLSEPTWRDETGVERPWSAKDKEEARIQALRMVELFEKGKAKGWVDASEDARIEAIAGSEPSLTVRFRAREVLDARRAGASERQRKAEFMVESLSKLARGEPERPASAGVVAR